MNVVSVYAVDWGMYAEQLHHSHEFEYVIGWVHGAIVKETDDFIAIAHQNFDSGDVRHVSTIPKVCILRRIDYCTLRQTDYEVNIIGK